MHLEVSLGLFAIVLMSSLIAHSLNVLISPYSWKWRLEKGKFSNGFDTIVRAPLNDLKTELLEALSEQATTKREFQGNAYVMREDRAREQAEREAELMENHPWTAYLDILGTEGSRWKRKLIKNPMMADIYKPMIKKALEAGMLGKRGEQLLALLDAEPVEDLLKIEEMM